MLGKHKLTEDIHQFTQLSGKDVDFNQKLEEFIGLLEHSDINSENIKGIKDKINSVLDHKSNDNTTVEKIKEVSLLNIGKMEQLDQLELLLNTNYLDSKQLKKQEIKNGLSRVVMAIIGILFITLGLAMIILPAPPYFEMFTIFYFNPDDGVTIMDLISLIIMAMGTLIVIRSFNRQMTK